MGLFQVDQIDLARQRGKSPPQHIHAVPELRNYQCELRFLNAEQSMFRLNFAALRVMARRETDVLLAHNLRNVLLLALLRRLRLIRTPLVVFVHSSSPSRISAFVAKGADRLLTLNRTAASLLREREVAHRRVVEVCFGADLNFLLP